MPVLADTGRNDARRTQWPDLPGLLQKPSDGIHSYCAPRPPGLWPLPKELQYHPAQAVVLSYHASRMKEIPVPSTDPDILLSLSSQIVSAYVTKNAVDHESLPTLIRDVRAALTSAAEPPAPVEEPPVPTVDPKKSVFRDHIICLEDGQKMKMLRRHLQTAHGMTPDEYRQRWGLPRDYPMAAPSYAAMRSDMAKEIGLGRKPADSGKSTPGTSTASKPTPLAEEAAGEAPKPAVEALSEESSGKAAGRGKRKDRPREKRAAPLRRRSPRAKG